MNLFCWNVAGWGPTIEFIRKDYKTLGEYFKLHNADIVCLQEFKQTNKNVEEKPANVGAREEGCGLSKRTAELAVSTPESYRLRQNISLAHFPLWPSAPQVGPFHFSLQAHG